MEHDFSGGAAAVLPSGSGAVDNALATAAPAAESRLLWPVHTAVPGRARFAVGALRGSGDCRRKLERGLVIVPGIHRVSASDLTGTALVHHEPDLAVAHVGALIASVLRGEIAPEDGGSDGSDLVWHGLAPGDVAARLATSEATGLTGREATRRLAEAGRNVLPRAAGRSGLSIAISQFVSLPVALLAGAAALSIVSGSFLEALVIGAVVGLNGVIGTITESRAENTIRSLGVAEAGTARALRDGVMLDLDPASLVPGDVLLLQRGAVVPADARLVKVDALSVSEAALTGESLPVAKRISALDGSLALADRRNMVYRGTVVTGGSGTGVVVATGTATQIGRVQRLVQEIGTQETGIQRQLDAFGRQLVWATLAASGLILGLACLRGYGLLQSVRSALSVAVAAVPEGLPMVATTTLAFGVGRMRRRNILMRRLDVIETLASVDTVCFDKTGTLTLNRMSVAEICVGEDRFPLSGPGKALGAPAADRRVESLMQVAILCSEAKVEPQEAAGPVVTGSATESALLHGAISFGLDPIDLRARCPRQAMQLRSDAYRFMATTHDTPDGAMVAVKGSPSDVLARCRWELGTNGARQILTDDRRAAIRRRNAGMAARALRVLGFAYRMGGEPLENGNGATEDLTWIGLAGMADPVRDTAGDVVARLKRAGLRTLMLTGDQPATARAVVEQIGLNRGRAIEVVDAATFDSMSPAERGEAIRRADAFARVSPAQKLEIVRALQKTGATVAMLGDGINDSPALRAADVGLAIGDEGAAAREVADVFIDTDDLGTVVEAVEQGRTTATNIRKALRFLIGTNTSEVMLMLAGTAAGFGAALTPMQLLWINLISDVAPGIGLALEPSEPGALEAGPRAADQPIIGREEVGGLFREAALVGSGAFAAGLYGAARYGASSVETRTLTFGSLVGAQLLHALTCRSTRDGIFTERRLPPNRPLSLILAGSFAAQSAAMLVPGVRRLLGIGPIGGLDALVMLAGGAAPFLIAERSKRRPAGARPLAPSALHIVKPARVEARAGTARPDAVLRRRAPAAGAPSR